MQKNLKEYFCDDIFEFGYLINRKKISEYLEKVENFDKFAQKRAENMEYYMGPCDGLSKKKSHLRF